MAFKVKASRYVEVCKKTLARPTRYQNSFPKNCGYYDGQYLWGDCWCFNPKTIIWGEAAGTPVCDNYRVGQTIDVATGIRNSGLPDTTGDQIMSKYCTQVSFEKMLQDKKAPCLLLIDGIHMGVYIGEFTQNGFKNDLLHTEKVVSMARSQSYDSAGSQFFIMLGTAEHLDYQYASFGKVIDGWDVVERIVNENRDKTSDDNGTLINNLTITTTKIDLNGYKPKSVKVIEEQ